MECTSVIWTTSCDTKICKWDWRGKHLTNVYSQYRKNGCETWSLSNTQLEKVVTSQRKMERIMVGVTLKDRKSTNRIRKQSGVTDIIKNLRENKQRWAKHVARRRDSRWSFRVTEWITRGHKISRGRPRARCCDDLLRYIGPTWRHIAKNRKLWKACREGFLLRERDNLTDDDDQEFYM